MIENGSIQELRDAYSIICRHQGNALVAVNVEHLMMCWELGGYLSISIKQGKWGDGIVQRLADYVHCQNPSLKGYSKRNLYNMVRFYETFSSESFLQESNEYQLDGFVQPVAAQIECGSANGFVQPTAARLEGVPKINPMPNFLTMTSYSNLMEILSYCRDAREQIFYMIYAHQHSLQKRELRKAIVSGTCANLLSDKKKMSEALQRQYPSASIMLKDRVYLDFLNLPQKHRETQLHKGLLAHMKDFILELGKEDFVFMGDEYPLMVGTATFHVDLLFYHRPLQCMVAMELKAGTFQPKDLGQLEFYMEALDRDVKRANENPTIGILLCQTAEQTVVEYALSRSMSPTMVAEYRNRMIPREVLQKTLNEYIEMNN